MITGIIKKKSNKDGDRLRSSCEIQYNLLYSNSNTVILALGQFFRISGNEGIMALVLSYPPS